MEHHGFCAGSDRSPGLRPLSKAEICQLDCHVRCPEYLGTAFDMALASSCLVPATRATVEPEHHDKLDFGFLLVPLGAAIAGLTRLRISYSAYIWTSVGFFSCWGMLGSVPRFDLVIFPLFIVLALIGARSRAFHLGYVVASSMLAALVMVMHSQWNWVA